MEKSIQYRRSVFGLAVIFMIIFCGLLKGTVKVEAAVYPKGYSVPQKVTQLAVVKYKGSSRGSFAYYEKNAEGTWDKIFSCKAYLGSRGIGKQRTGDKKTPIGMYSLGQSFGILKNPGTKMPYIKVTKYHYWCGDSGSEYYNQLIRTDVTGHTCRGEHLIDYKGVYDYATFITYNKAGKPGKGSAIFLHCDRGRSTAGCVAISKKCMKQILRRLNPEANPKIIIADYR